MQVDDFSQYTDEEREELERLVRVKDHTFGPGPSNRRQRRKIAKETGYFKRKKPQRSTTRAKVR